MPPNHKVFLLEKCLSKVLVYYMHTLPLCSVGDRLATGYESDGSEEPLYDIGWWGPASQMYSSASDLNKVGRSSMAAARSRVAP